MDKKSIFRPESLARIESPEQIDELMRVSRPSVWVILLALLVAAASVIVWSVVGTLPETMTTGGVTSGGTIVRAYEGASNAATNIVGCPAVVTLPDGATTEGTVESVSQNPYSEAEIRENLAYDWIAENVIPESYAYEITIRTEEALEADVLASVAITTDEVKPIQFVIG